MSNCHPSSKAEWNNLRFPRTRTDSQWVEMERTSIPEPWVKVIWNGVGLVLFFAFVVLVVMHG